MTGIDEPDIDPAISLEDGEIRVGEVVSVEPSTEARTDGYTLDVHVHTEVLQSAAGLTVYTEAELSVYRRRNTGVPGRPVSP